MAIEVIWVQGSLSEFDSLNSSEMETVTSELKQEITDSTMDESQGEAGNQGKMSILFVKTQARSEARRSRRNSI